MTTIANTGPPGAQTARGDDRMRIIGLMSGTSMDGVDAALVEVQQRSRRIACKSLASFAVPYPSRLRVRLLEIAGGMPVTASDLGSLSIAVGVRFAMAATGLMKRSGVGPREIDAIASHGQTVAHRPGKRTVTVQIGEAAVIAERVGITTIADFRVADTAAGGEGAPLVPWVHHALFADGRRTRAIVNVGGMANVTILPAGGGREGLIASDTGPGNVLIDHCVQRLSNGRRRFDRDGRLAAAGIVDERLVRRVLTVGFFRRRLPASTGREDFGEALAADVVELGARLCLEDETIVASVTMATARSIARACERLAAGRVIDEVLMCGGGAHNSTLRRMLAERMPRACVTTTADVGVDPGLLEAQAFAVLGWMALRGQAGNVPATTGAVGERVLGKIVPGRNYCRVMLKNRQVPGGS